MDEREFLMYSWHVYCLETWHIKGITHPTMLARYNLRGQEALDDSGAFLFWMNENGLNQW